MPVLASKDGRYAPVSHQEPLQENEACGVSRGLLLSGAAAGTASLGRFQWCASLL